MKILLLKRNIAASDHMLNYTDWSREYKLEWSSLCEMRCRAYKPFFKNLPIPFKTLGERDELLICIQSAPATTFAVMILKIGSCLLYESSE